MSDNFEHLMLEEFGSLRAEVASVKDDTREIKTRLAVVEAGIAMLASTPITFNHVRSNYAAIAGCGISSSGTESH